MIHYKKTFATYLFFAASLIGLCPQVQQIRSFGTDGEQALISAFSHELRYSQNLTSFIHVCRNITEKLRKCNIPAKTSQQILHDIFGRKMGTVTQEGLVDASDADDFNNKCLAVIEKWKTMDVRLSSSTDIYEFIRWFKDNKVKVIQESMWHL
jgi:hypothetical protein